MLVPLRQQPEVDQLLRCTLLRPATGQTPPISFRPPKQLREELDELAKAEGRDRSDVLIEAVHDWIRKKHREQSAARQN